jgi:hypothetical protein
LLGSSRVGDPLSEGVEFGVGVLQGPTSRSGECCALDERECFRERTRADRGDRRRKSPIVTDEERRGHEQLRSIRPDLRLRGRRVGTAETADRPRGVGKDREVEGVEAPVRDTRLVHPSDRPPEVLDQDVAHLGRADLRQEAPPRLHDEDRVLLHRPGGDHREHRHAGSLGEECQEGLVLHLLEPAEREARRLVAVPEVRPDRIQQLPVPGVASIHLDVQAATVEGRRIHHGDTARSESSVLHRVRLDPKVEERRHHFLGRRTSPG